jgi:hypothetical protein
MPYREKVSAPQPEWPLFLVHRLRPFARFFRRILRHLFSLLIFLSISNGASRLDPCTAMAQERLFFVHCF